MEAQRGDPANTLRILGVISLLLGIAAAIAIWVTMSWRYVAGNSVRTEVDWGGIVLGATCLLSGFVWQAILSAIANICEDVEGIRKAATEKKQA